MAPLPPNNVSSPVGPYLFLIVRFQTFLFLQLLIVSGARSEKEDAVVERGKKGIGIR